MVDNLERPAVSATKQSVYLNAYRDPVTGHVAERGEYSISGSLSSLMTGAPSLPKLPPLTEIGRSRNRSFAATASEVLHCQRRTSARK